jgi:hypothetical protein
LQTTLQDMSITSLVIVSGGRNYLAGDVSVSGGGGNNFSATFGVDPSGSIDQITIINHGKMYTAIPTSVNLHYPGSSLLQVSCMYGIILDVLSSTCEISL